MLTAEFSAAGERSRSRRVFGALLQYAPAITLVVIAIALWEGLCRLLDVPSYLWPKPSVIVRGFGEDWGDLSSSLGVTLEEVLLGFAMAIAAGLVIGTALHLSATLRRAVYPILIASQSVPTVVLAPVLVILLGFGIWPKLAIIGLFTFFPIVVNTVDGLGSVDREYVRMMLTLDADRWAVFRRVEFPTALPLIFSGVRIGATYSAIGAVFGEWAGSEKGLGHEMIIAQGQLQTSTVFEAVILVTLIAVALFTAVSLLERLLIPWARAGAAQGAGGR
jgi:putative hydroxymethylpyrimidine transport system permease protein